MIVTLRPATTDDIPFVWDCRQELEAGVGRIETAAEIFSRHQDWMIRALADTNRMFAIAIEASPARARLGYVRVDPAGPGTPAWMASLCLHSTARRRGLAQPTLELGVIAAAKAGHLPLLADIHTTNLVSRKVFSACGFVPIAPNSPHEAGLPSSFDRFIYTPAEGTRHGY